MSPASPLPGEKPVLQLERVQLAYGPHVVVHELSFSLARGTLACLLGPSGCGKTTVLRAIAGFEPVRRGVISFGETPVAGPDFQVPPEARRIGMVFQDYALFPHLDVGDNIAFGLRGLSRAERQARVDALLRLTGLAGMTSKYPHQLSGGQQQRVALARALAPRPALILLDEPFSSLDVDLRERLALELRDILKEAGATAILVTHDQHEAFNMADEIGVMQAGRLMQWDSPYQLYHEPADRFVADFIGQGAFVRGVLREGNRVDIELGTLQARHPLRGRPGEQVDVLLRPDDVVHDDASTLQAQVVHKAFRGAEILYTLRLPSGTEFLSLVPSHHNHPLGQPIGIRLDVDHVVAFGL